MKNDAYTCLNLFLLCNNHENFFVGTRNAACNTEPIKFEFHMNFQKRQERRSVTKIFQPYNHSIEEEINRTIFIKSYSL